MIRNLNSKSRVIKILIILVIFTSIYVVLKYTFNISDYTGYNISSFYSNLLSGHVFSRITTSFASILSLVSYQLLNYDLSMKLFFPLFYIPYVVITFAIIHKLSNNTIVSLLITLAVIISLSAPIIHNGVHPLGELFVAVFLLLVLLSYTQRISNECFIILTTIVGISIYFISYDATAIYLLFSILLIVICIVLLIVSTQISKNKRYKTVQWSRVPSINISFNKQIGRFFHGRKSRITFDNNITNKLKLVIAGLLIPFIFTIGLLSFDSFKSTFLSFLARNSGYNIFSNILSHLLSLESTTVGTTSEFAIVDSFNMSGVIVYLLCGGFIILTIIGGIWCFKKTKCVDWHFCTFIAIFSFIFAYAIYAIIRMFIGQLSVSSAFLPGVFSLAFLFGNMVYYESKRTSDLNVFKILRPMLVILLLIFVAISAWCLFIDNSEMQNDSRVYFAYGSSSEWIKEYTIPKEFTVYSDVETLGMIITNQNEKYGKKYIDDSYDFKSIEAIIYNDKLKMPQNGYFIADTYSPTMTFTWDSWDKLCLRGLNSRFDGNNNLQKIYSENKDYNIYSII